MRPICTIILIQVLTSLSPLSAQVTWYVDASAPGPGTGTALSPFTIIQDGINAASGGDTVLVLPGVYQESLISFLGKAITVRGEQGPAVTTIDAVTWDTVVVFETGEGPTSVLEGLSIANGMGYYDPWAGPGRRAGGIDVLGASPTIRNCVIRDCTGSWGGWTGCTSTEPVGFPGGPGALLVVGAGSHPVLEHCTLVDNTGGIGGDGMDECGYYCRTPSPGLIGGAGAVCALSGTTVDLLNCLVVQNLGGGGGQGGDGTDDPSYCGTVSGAPGGPGGPGALHANGGSFYLVGTSATRNDGGPGGPPGAFTSIVGPQGHGAIEGAGFNVTGANTIVWGNLPTTGPIPALTCSVLWAASTGTGNINVDPLFVDALGGDYHVRPGSPCVDAGDNAAAGLMVFDMDGDPRIFHGAVDMGADETVLSVSGEQPGGPGAPLTILNHNLTPGNEYYNIFSLDVCSGGPGSGSLVGLCVSSVANAQFIIDQLLAPVGAVPSHFIAPAGVATWGPFVLAPLAVDALCFDITGGALGSISHVVRITVQ